jgi:dextranase
MKIVSFTSLRGFYQPLEMMEFRLCLHTEQAGIFHMRLTVHHFQHEIAYLEQELVLTAGENIRNVSLPAIKNNPAGYGLRVDLVNAIGEVKDSIHAAIDTLNHWTDFPRYGFLTDFTSQRKDLDAALDNMAAYHINGIQFYDWQYRHDELITPVEEFTDPLGRSLSIHTIKRLLDGAHQRGMACMPYLAVYAASLLFWSEHPDWRLFNNEGKALDFEGFLGIMNPAADSPWINHLVEQCRRVLTELPFDGLHVDQYGEPKIAYDHHGLAVDIPEAFKQFVIRLKSEFPDKSVVFNAVGNWPIDALTSAPVDFVYIEIWPPAITFQDVHQIVLEARKKSSNKPVVIAHYLPADRQANNRLTNAVIMACGGSRIEWGENNRLLSNPYFPKHQGIPQALAIALKTDQDFLIRYSELIGPTANHIELSHFQGPVDVMTIARQFGCYWGINLINFSGLHSTRWDEPQPNPAPLHAVDVAFDVPIQPVAVWVASPDTESPAMTQLKFSFQEGRLSLTLPELNLWSLLILQFNQEDLML